MLVSSVGCLNHNVLGNLEDYRSKTRYYENALLGRIEGEHRPVDDSIGMAEKYRIFLSSLKNLFHKEHKISQSQALDMIG